MNKISIHNNSCGHSLVEMMVALGLLGILSLAIMNGFNSISEINKNTKRGEEIQLLVNSLRLKTTRITCKTNLNLSQINADLSDINLSGQQFVFDATILMNMRLSNLKLLKTETDFKIYSSIIKIDVSRLTSENEKEELMLSLLYLKVDNGQNVLECSSAFI